VKVCSLRIIYLEWQTGNKGRTRLLSVKETNIFNLSKRGMGKKLALVGVVAGNMGKKTRAVD
jgi:hypothetical protein